jgi:hypothetical protein
MFKARVIRATEGSVTTGLLSPAPCLPPYGFCVTVNRLPFTVIRPARVSPVRFCATLYVTVPVPLPLAPEVIVIHGT